MWFCLSPSLWNINWISSICRKNLGLAIRSLGGVLDTVTLYDLGQITYPFWASVSPSIKKRKIITVILNPKGNNIYEKFSAIHFILCISYSVF